MTDIEFVSLDPSNPAQVEEWWDVLSGSIGHDTPDYPLPSRSVSLMMMLYPSRSASVEHVLARVGGTVAASAELTWTHVDNRHVLEFELEVHPRFRRRGVGTALLAEVERRAGADGRTALVGYTPQPIPGGPHRSDGGCRFAERSGYTNSQQEIHRRVDLTTVDETVLEERLADAWAKADGYRLVQWTGMPADDYLIEGMAYLDSRLMADAPMGDLDLQPLSDDADRIRGDIQRSRDRGMLVLNTGVRHVDSGRLVAWSDIHVNPGHETDAFQGITIVDSEHRGHRLGSIVKIENQRLLRRYRPMLRYVHTWNAESNDFMIDINEAVGYRAVDRWIGYQKRLG